MPVNVRCEWGPEDPEHTEDTEDISFNCDFIQSSMIAA